MDDLIIFAIELATWLSSFEPTSLVIISPNWGWETKDLDCLRTVSYSADLACPVDLASSASFCKAAKMADGSLNLTGEDAS